MNRFSTVNFTPGSLFRLGPGQPLADVWVERFHATVPGLFVIGYVKDHLWIFESGSPVFSPVNIFFSTDRRYLLKYRNLSLYVYISEGTITPVEAKLSVSEAIHLPGRIFYRGKPGQNTRDTEFRVLNY